MKIRGLNDYDIVNYKEPAFFIVFPFCSFKCDKEAGIQVCQNLNLTKEPINDISMSYLLTLYNANPLVKNLVCGGLEPLDSYSELKEFLTYFREKSTDKIIIYTGYNEDEIIDKINELKQLGNLIIKFGRYIPNKASRYDEILGVTLASDNQYAKYYE